MWWLFSFPWTVLETCLDVVASAVLLVLGLLPPHVLFSTLQFFERCAAFALALCVSCIAGLGRGFHYCFGGGVNGEAGRRR